MRKRMLVPLCMLFFLRMFSQEEPLIASLEQQAELLANNEETENEDDSFLQQWAFYKKHPLNLNEASEEDLSQLPFLNDLQIKNFLDYRRLLGKLVDIHELQAVPAWDVAVIQKLLPYVVFNDTKNNLGQLKNSFSSGDQSLLVRYGQILEKEKGFRQPSNNESHYNGSVNRIYLRYSNNYKNIIRWGVQGDKDAGEQFFRGKQKAGFDFYSVHFFAALPGILKALAIGDFTVNMGQGLIQWQTMAFKKSAEITAVKRQASFIRPYTSGGEFNFQRGGAILLQRGNWEAGAFISFKNISANLEKDQPGDEGHITSFVSTGYHRTNRELEDKNNVHQTGLGLMFKYKKKNGHLAVNAVHYALSNPIQKQDKPYNLWALSGNEFTNVSMDYSLTFKNVHLFGEAAIDKNMNTAFLNGVLVAAAPSVNFSLVHRSISSRYQALYANAFTENFSVNNERGVYAGLSLKPSGTLTIQAYADVYNFPWLKYRVDAPSRGSDYLLTLSYAPNKQFEIYSRFNSESKPANRSGQVIPFNGTGNVLIRNGRIHSNLALNPNFTLRNRLEVTVYDRKGPTQERGILYFSDILYNPPLKTWDANCRIEHFETDGYHARLYAYENNVPYNLSIPAAFDKGYRYYINFHKNIRHLIKSDSRYKIKAGFWIRFAQTIFSEKSSTGSGLALINGNKKTDINMQLMLEW